MFLPCLSVHRGEVFTPQADTPPPLETAHWNAFLLLKLFFMQTQQTFTVASYFFSVHDIIDISHWLLEESHLRGCFCPNFLGRWRDLWMVFCQSVSAV